MKKKKLRAFVLPTVYIMVIGVLFISIAFLGSTLQDSTELSDMSVSSIVDENVVPVISNTEDDNTTTTTIVKPYTSDKVEETITFYDMNDDEETQQKSLIYYEKTYMPSTGVLYTTDEVFDVICVYDGTVTKIDTDDILGNYVEITHNTNLKSIYYSLGEIKVELDATVKTGDVIATSGENKLTDSSNSLFFEVSYNGFNLDPTEFYVMDITTLN